MIYKCTACGKVNWSENGFSCPACGAKTIGFRRPKIEDDFDSIPDGKRVVAFLLGAGLLVVGLAVFVVLGLAM
jgi:DNA-directed RNA polymerase subunit RPC12/RpoP